MFLWPSTRREAFARFASSIILSTILGPALVVVVRSWWPSLFEAAKDVSVMYGSEPALGFLFIAAPLMVAAGLPAWWIIGAIVRWLDKRHDQDIGQLAHDAAAIVRDVRESL
jgi:hypothetical protein